MPTESKLCFEAFSRVGRLRCGFQVRRTGVVVMVTLEVPALGTRAKLGSPTRFCICLEVIGGCAITNMSSFRAH